MDATCLASNVWIQNMQYHAIAVICSPVFAFEGPPFDPGSELCKDSLRASHIPMEERK